MTARYVVMLSAGMDSAVNLLLASRSGEVEAAVTVDYGQRAAAREIEKAGQLCRDVSVEHLVLEFPWLAELGEGGALLDEAAPLPEIDSLTDAGAETAGAVWVPNRNGLLANVGATIAEARRAEVVVMGFNREEATTFPDNSRDFLDAANNALALSTLSRVRLDSFTIDMKKSEIFMAGEGLGIDWGHVWSCYRGGALMCGRCESCARFLRAAAAAEADVRHLFEEG